MNDIEIQLAKLRSGTVSLNVKTSANRAAENVADQPSIGNQVGNEVPSLSVENVDIQNQVTLLKRFRMLNQQRQEGEDAANRDLLQKEQAIEKAYLHYSWKAKNTLDEINALKVSGQKALEAIRMQMPLLESTIDLPESGDADLPESGDAQVLDRLKMTAKHAEQNLRQAIDAYAQWWAIRCARLFLFVILAVIATWFLLWLAGSASATAGSFYAGLNTALGSGWLGRIVWVLIVIVSVIAFGTLVVGVGWVLFQKYFDTQPKRTEARFKLTQRRSDLVRLVFSTEDSNLTRHQLGRMWVMTIYWIKQRVKK